MLRDLGGWHLLIILGIVVLLFGSTKLPALARGVGQSMKIFKAEIKDDKASTPAAAKAEATVADVPVAPVAPVVPTVTPTTPASAAAPVSAPGRTEL